MAIAPFLRRWPHLPRRAALLLGLGALSAAGSHADASPSPATGALDLGLRSSGGRVWLSEAGGEFRELPLGDTAEARHLKRLIADHDPTGGRSPVRLRPTILAGGGGMGFHWWGPAKTETRGKEVLPAKPEKPGKTGEPTKKDPAAAGKKS